MDLFLLGLKTAIQPYYLFMAFLGAFLGVAFGAIPGINAILGVALLIPMTLTLDPIAAFILLGAVYTGGAVGGAFPAILFKIPGAPEAAATTFDGYPLAQKGQAGKAIGMALFASTTGGIFGVLALSFLSPQLAKIAISFSAQEYFAFALLGLTIIVALGDSILKAVISGLIGLLLATVGIDKLTTAERFTFGAKSITGGFEFVSIIIGNFAVGEVLERVQSLEVGTLTTKEKVQTKLPSLREVLECKWTLLRSYVIGTIIGILPGLGPSATIAMLLPFTFGMSPVPAMIMLCAIVYGSKYGGSTTSILIDVPGENASVVTTFDGYQLALQGRAGAVLGLSAIGSFVGGVLGLFGLIFVAVPLVEISLKFGPAEYFSLIVMGMLTIVFVGGKSITKSLMSAVIGLALSLHALTNLRRSLWTQDYVPGVAQDAVVSVFSREDEREADLYGLWYAYQAGYHLERGLLVYERLAAISKDPFEGTYFLDSHPTPLERLARMKKAAGYFKAGRAAEVFPQTAHLNRQPSPK